MLAGALMVQGTTSDAGKSTLVAALCRVFTNRKLQAAPFKPQNMALNSAVTSDGGEIGRAQALQALACNLEPHTDMNPVLIKPSSDTGAQIIVQGTAKGSMDAARFHEFKPLAKNAVAESFFRLKNQYPVVVVEGAGSPAEVNLRQGDIANMGFAEDVDCPVIIIADIDKGGVFAHLVGTLSLLSASEQNRVKGFVINKFRGDIKLLEPGLEWLEQYTGKPVLGVLPYLHDLYLDSEDAIETQQYAEKHSFKIVVPVLPRISNHTDFDALRLNSDIDLQFISIFETPPPCDLIILPGSKNVRDDLHSLIQNNWRNALQRHLRYGGKLLGICGGFQMLGETIADPLGIEGEPGATAALNLLPLRTTLAKEKVLSRKAGTLKINGVSAPVNGYEIHHGDSAFSRTSSSTSSSTTTAAILFEDQSVDGCFSSDNQVFGTYLHGIFDNAEACKLLLQWAGLVDTQPVEVAAIREQQINRLTDIAEKSLDIEKIIEITGLIQAAAT